MIFFVKSEVPMDDKDRKPAELDPHGGGRRQGERRQDGKPPKGEDRRSTARRSGADRRASPRDDGLG
jgi:hypothetical protein